MNWLLPSLHKGSRAEKCNIFSKLKLYLLTIFTFQNLKKIFIFQLYEEYVRRPRNQEDLSGVSYFHVGFTTVLFIPLNYLNKSMEITLTAASLKDK